MASALKQTGFIKDFVCLGDKCEDTCCKGWGMQVDGATLARYEKDAPELLHAVMSGEAQHVMKRDPQTDYCVKYEGGWCGIHKTRGTDFLGDACHFYPRITRQLGDTNLMSATLSCPEIVRSVLASDSAFAISDTAIERLPNMLKDYLPEGIKSEDALKVHDAFIAAALDPAVSFERAFSRIASVSRSLQTLPVASWPAAVTFYMQNADARLPAPEARPEDPFNLLHTLCGLIAASKKTLRPRLMQTVAEMERALACAVDLDHVTITLTPESEARAEGLKKDYAEKYSALLQPVLKRWLAAELSMALYPFSGFGETLTDRITTLGVRAAMVKWALICRHSAGKNAGDDTVRIVQSLSRFLDHLAEPVLLLNICAETGWIREARMRGIIADF